MKSNIFSTQKCGRVYGRFVLVQCLKRIVELVKPGRAPDRLTVYFSREAAYAGWSKPSKTHASIYFR